MKLRRKQPVNRALLILAAIWMFIVLPLSAMAAPYAAVVMDARNGKILHAKNADTRLHPASLTKMMTLYVAFEAIQHGEISLNTKVRISKKAASEPPSRLGLRAGQTIALRYLIRAAAVKSANDAATAIGEAISGSEANFAARMTRTARAMGMQRTTFKNAHGLTQSGHLSTARDMTILGRHLFYDYPEYYNLFSRLSVNAGVKTVSHTNRALLQSYRGADGIKTGYTRAAGFNLVASAERGRERIIATVFGGKSTASRNKRVAELLDYGFQRAPRRAAVRRPKKPAYAGMVTSRKKTKTSTQPVAMAAATPKHVAKKPNTAVKQSVRPRVRQIAAVQEPVKVVENSTDITKALQEVALAETVQEVAETPLPLPKAKPETGAAMAQIAKVSPRARPANLVVAQAATSAEAGEEPKVAQATPDLPLPEDVETKTAAETKAPEPVQVAQAEQPQIAKVRPKARKANLGQTQTAALAPAPAPKPAPEPKEQLEVVTRVSTSSGRHWGINIGRYPSEASASRVLLKTALSESSTLSDSSRKVIRRSDGFDANFFGMSRETADLACRRLQAKQVPCFMIGPG